MSRLHLRPPATLVPSLLAALTTWVALWAWAGFVESPSGYLVPVLGGALLVAVTGMLLRSAHVPALLVVPAQLAVVTLWLCHRWAEGASIGGWIPTPAALREVGDTLQLSVTAAQTFAAPVSDDVPQIFPLLVLAGALTTILVDFLACGLRRVPVAGLPLLAVYTAPVSILGGGVPWWGFAVGAVGFLAMLSEDEGRRLSQWGRQVSTGNVYDSLGSGVSTASVRASARKIGLTATGLAVVAPLAIPTLSTSILPGNGPGGGDGNSVTITNPLVDLRRDLVRGRDVDLIRLRTTSRDPSYLRVTVLDTFNGQTWKPSGRDIPRDQRADGRLPSPPGLSSEVDRTEQDYEFTVEDSFSSLWLPTPYPVRAVEVPGDWRFDRTTLDFISAEDGQTTAGLSYALTALEVAPTGIQLADAGPTPETVYTPYTDLPRGVPDLVPRLAREVTAGSTTRFEKAVALQRWFRDPNNFTYSLGRSEGNGTDDLVQFLGTGPDSRVGYCEQFAAAMAVMGRSIGIASRVAVGFLSPDRQPDGSYVYSAHDLHAWPEMYFEGVGWVRFEPTPPDRAGVVPSYTRGRLDLPEPAEIPTSGVPTRDPDAVERDLQRAQDDAAGSASDGGGRGPWITGAVVLLLMGLLALPRLLRSLLRRRRWALASDPAEVAEAAWAELRDTAADLGLPWDDSVTLRTRARGLVTSFGAPPDSTAGSTADATAGLTGDGRRTPERGAGARPEATRALERLVTDLERARYSRQMTPRASGGSAAVHADVALCVEALHDGAGRRRRRLATWLPVSLVRNRPWRAIVPPATHGRLVEAGVDRAT